MLNFEFWFVWSLRHLTMHYLWIISSAWNWKVFIQIIQKLVGIEQWRIQKWYNDHHSNNNLIKYQLYFYDFDKYVIELCFICQTWVEGCGAKKSTLIRLTRKWNGWIMSPWILFYILFWRIWTMFFFASFSLFNLGLGGFWRQKPRPIALPGSWMGE